MFDKNTRVLIIVESPEKSRTITKIFHDEGFNKVVVMATIGHFTCIADGSGYWNTGIHPEENFKIDFELDRGKKDNIKKLKEQISYADKVYICSDGDREGEAIGWSCVKFLKIPKTKYKRATYHEINKRAIFEALENAHDLDENLVNAAHSRSVLDKMVGYRLSPIAKKSVYCKSVGRCQSAGLKLLVEREEEIQNFKAEKYFDLFLFFTKNKTDFKAKYQGTDSTPIKQIKSQEDCDKIYEDCKGNKFIVKTVEFKDKLDNPKLPFCTASFQQEVTSKLNLTTEQAMSCAQQLFESGKISYHRTDDTTMSPEFKLELKNYVTKRFGKEYYSEVREGKKDDNAQEGHECLRVLDLELTPEKFSQTNTNELLNKVYKIIYNRTVASSMKPSIISETVYNIYNGKHKFTMTSNELKFDGYKKIYNYKDDEENSDSDLIKETFNKGEELKDCSLESVPKETQPKPRYKEATFLKELQQRGIGRPSTYASIVSTIKSEDRGYCKVENKCLVPTEKGIKLSHFLDDKFSDIINIDYTKEMEKSLDLIANGKLNYLDFLQDFYNKLEESSNKVTELSVKVDKKCPECGNPLVIRKGKYGKFLGCSNYPKCKHIEKIQGE